MAGGTEAAHRKGAAAGAKRKGATYDQGLQAAKKAGFLLESKQQAYARGYAGQAYHTRSSEPDRPWDRAPTAAPRVAQEFSEAQRAGSRAADRLTHSDLEEFRDAGRYEDFARTQRGSEVCNHAQFRTQEEQDDYINSFIEVAFDRMDDWESES